MATARVRYMAEDRDKAPRGMTLDDTLRMFLRSREQGHGTAVRPSRPRTLQNYQSDLQYFFDFLKKKGYTRWLQIERGDVLEFVAWVQKKTGWSVSSQKKRLRSLKALFYFVQMDEECSEMGMKGFLRQLPSIGKTESRVKSTADLPTADELARFISSFKKQTRDGLRDYTAFMVMLDCGARAGELCHLTMEHLRNLDEGKIKIPEEGKTGTRDVWISPDTARDLRYWLHKRESFALCDYVFVTNRGEFCDPYVFAHQFYRKSIAAGIPKGKITPHMLRHYFCTTWLREGGDLAKLREMTGHTSFDTLKNYTRLTGDESVKQEQLRVAPRRVLNKVMRKPVRPRKEIA